MRLGVLQTHPIQYFAPWLRALAARCDLIVYFAHRQTAAGQAAAGFGVPFEWDVPLTDGYLHRFLHNRARRPDVARFLGCDTPELAGLIRDGRFDAFVVPGWSSRSCWQAMRASWRTRTPLLVRGDSQLRTTRSALKRALKYPVYRAFIPRFDAYLSVGQNARDYYLHYGADPSRIFSVPHCVDNDFFISRRDALAPRRRELRADWGFNDDQTVFLFVGKLIPKKRTIDLLNAIKLMSHSRIGALIVGDGPLRGELEARARGLPVRFAGFLNQGELPRAYAAADALVLPSDGSETWGLVVNEAMASSLPAIVSDEVGCAPDLVEPGATGWRFPCGDTPALARLLERAAEEPSVLSRMGAAARARVDHFSIARAVDGTLAAVEASSSRHRSA